MMKNLCVAFALYFVSMSSGFAASQGVITPQAFGTVTGVNDTAIIHQAMAYAYVNNLCTYFPGGLTYAYNGTGENYPNICLLGDGDPRSIIQIGAGNYLIDMNQATARLDIQKLAFVNGAGVYRNRYTTYDVGIRRTIRENAFFNQTGAVISTNGTDNPYWKIQDNMFQINQSTGIGIALSGLSDADTICGNDFFGYHIGIKIGMGGNNAHICRNNFTPAGVASSQRVNIWIVPQVGETNSGEGLTIHENKHGNEGLGPTDFAILFADENTSIGTYFGDHMPKYTTPSTGFVTGVHIYDEAIYGGTTLGVPSEALVFSTTPNVWATTIGSIWIGGTPPTYLLQYLTANCSGGASQQNVFGPYTILGSQPSFTVANTCGN
jgi:hypothetical protein